MVHQKGTVGADVGLRVVGLLVPFGRKKTLRDFSALAQVVVQLGESDSQHNAVPAHKLRANGKRAAIPVTLLPASSVTHVNPAVTAS